MSQVLHVLRKDLRHLRWLLILWLAILALRVALAAIGAATAGDEFAAAIVFREMSALLSVLQPLMLALIVARLIHAEALVGWNAFWLTRPYSRRALMTAKLLFLAGALALAPLAADLATMAIVHAGPRAQIAAASGFLYGHLWWALALCVIAVLTPSLARFALASIGIFVGLTVAVLMAISVALALGTMQPETVTAPMVHDPTPAVVSLVVSIASALAVIAYQYRYRRWRIAAVLAGIGVVAMAFAPGLWPWPFLRPSAPHPGSWSHDVDATPVTIDPRMAMQTRTRDAFEPTGPRIREIYARVTLTGLPADFEVQSVTARGTLTLPDGTTLRSLRNEGMQGPGDIDDDSPTRSALGVSKILNDVAERHRTWPSLLAIDEQDHQRHKGRSGRFSATLDFHLQRTRVRGTLPLRSGVSLTLDERLSRVEVVRANPAPGGYRLVVRQWHVHPLMAPRESVGYEFMLRNRPEGTAVEMRNQMWSGSFAGTSRGARALSTAFAGWTVGSSSLPFAVYTASLEFPVRISGGFVGLAELPSTWFNDAELVVLERAYAGTVQRSVTIPDFRIPEN